MDKRTTSVEISAQGQGFVLVDVGTSCYSLSQFTAHFPHIFAIFNKCSHTCQEVYNHYYVKFMKGKEPIIFFSLTIWPIFFPDKLTGRKQICYVDL